VWNSYHYRFYLRGMFLRRVGLHSTLVPEVEPLPRPTVALKPSLSIFLTLSTPSGSVGTRLSMATIPPPSCCLISIRNSYWRFRPCTTSRIICLLPIARSSPTCTSTGWTRPFFSACALPCKLVSRKQQIWSPTSVPSQALFDVILGSSTYIPSIPSETD
jgi:hypothetical protein